MTARTGKRFPCDRISRELTLTDCFVDPGQVLMNDSPGAKVEMAYFGVAHLAVGQSDVEAACAELAAGVVAIELIVKRSAREQRRVAILLSRSNAAGIDAPAVANDEHHRFAHRRAVS